MIRLIDYLVYMQKKLNTRTENITFEITGDSAPTAHDKTFNLLGAEYNGEDISQPGGPVINVPQSSTKQVQRDNMNTAYWIKAMTINASSEDQLNEQLEIISQDITGHRSSDVLNLNRFKNPANPQAKQLLLNENTGFQPIKVYGQIGLRGVIKANAYMNILMTLEYVYRPGFNKYCDGAGNVNIDNLLASLYKGAPGSRIMLA